MKQLKFLKRYLPKALADIFFKQKAPVQPPIPKKSIFFEKVLLDLKNTHSPLTITFHSSTSPYVSMLLAVDCDHEFIIIDEINAADGHHLACRGESFTIEASDNGIPILFQSKVIGFGQAKGISYYRLPFPHHLEYQQRRSATRFATPEEGGFQADFLLPKAPHIYANILEISLSGMRLSMPHNVKTILDNMIKINHCRISTPFLPTHEFSLNIKHCRYEIGKQKTVLGCEFDRLDNAGLKFLSMLMNRLKPIEKVI